MGHARDLVRRVDEEISSDPGLETTVHFRRALYETERRLPDEQHIDVTRQARPPPDQGTKEDDTLYPERYRLLRQPFDLLPEGLTVGLPPLPQKMLEGCGIMRLYVHSA